MASSSPPTVDASDMDNRKSARVRRQPEHFTSSPFANGKRKRDGAIGGDGDSDDAEEHTSDEEGSADESPDEEKIREQAKRARKAKSAASKLPAAKKSKVDDVSPFDLPIRNVRAPARKRAPRKIRAKNTADAEAAGGLYADLFARDKPLDEIVSDWTKGFNEHESHAVAALINLTLKSAGCDAKVTELDVEDPDSATSRMSDIQQEYQASDPTEYPLIAKGKGAAAFRSTLCGFIRELMQSLAATHMLWDKTELIENIQVWLTPMTSATNRGFRHTSTTLSLAIMTTLCEIAKELAEKSTNNQRHAETERKKPRANKERVRQLEDKVRNASRDLEFVEALLKDWFDTVFIHRYRDIDAAIRRDCVAALGEWIVIMPDAFFDGQHLRYLGWLLSDSNSSTRLEDLKQLARLYGDRDKIGGLKTFTERFRERMVEIATSDAEANVRLAGIELLNLLRVNDLLEPDDIDAGGRLIFHDDVRIRKGVASFFSENVKDLYNAKVDELGGLEALEEALPEVSDDNFEAPRLEWLEFKSLTETLLAYDQEDAALPSQIKHNSADGSLNLQAAPAESRFTLAVDVLYDQLPELRNWQAVAGYLLFEHSPSRAKRVSEDTLSRVKHECKLTESEETVLLEVLSASVKQDLIGIAEKIGAPKGKLTKRQREDLQEQREEGVRHLVAVIPKLFLKFGDNPSTSAAVLRLEAVLALPSLHGLHQDTVAGAVLLDDLGKQFMSHGTDEVLAPATSAILHAKSYAELDETASEKLSTLWDDVVGNLADLLDPATLTVRGASSNEALLALSNNLLRVVRLSTISDCSLLLENSDFAVADASAGQDGRGPIDFILDLIQRAMPSEGPAPDFDDAALEDEVASRAAEAALFYFRWKLMAVMAAVTAGTTTELAPELLEALADRQDSFANKIERALKSRKPEEQVSTSLAGHLLDMYTSSAVLRTVSAKPGIDPGYTVLIRELEHSQEKLMMKVFAAAEQDFAKLTRRKLDAAALGDGDEDVNAEPEDNDALSEGADDENDIDDRPATQASQQRTVAKRILPLLAEQKLCQLASKLIYAISAGVISDQATRKRLERNKSKLGPNFKEVLAYLDAGNISRKSAKAKSKAEPKFAVNGGLGKKTHPKSNAIVADDEEEDEIEDADGLDGHALHDQAANEDELMEELEDAEDAE